MIIKAICPPLLQSSFQQIEHQVSGGVSFGILNIRISWEKTFTRIVESMVEYSLITFICLEVIFNYIYNFLLSYSLKYAQFEIMITKHQWPSD